jgi:NAD(P)-dependent dehydrogenase (short-subunit alcohol dehydrogenase family)
MHQLPETFYFGAATTAQEVIDGVDLSGKVAIVTGGYSGLGLETTRTLASAGARVIVPARDRAKAELALRAMPRVSIEPMDLLDPASIDSFAQRFLSAGEALHILVNSAAIMACPLSRDARGYEVQFATNHLGHFQLVERLWPALVKARGARIVAVSSRGHHFSSVILEDPNFERRPYDRWAAYGQSKTANSLFALAVDERGRRDGIRAFSVHPGGILSTGLGKFLSRKDLESMDVLDQQGKPILDPSKQLKTVEQGAATIVWCAVSDELEGFGGVYCENCEVAQIVSESDLAAIARGDKTRRFGVMPYAIDQDLAQRLWTLSEQLVFGDERRKVSTQHAG